VKDDESRGIHDTVIDVDTLEDLKRTEKMSEKMRNKIPIAADIIIEKNNQIVLIKRKFEPFKGKLEPPGGFVEDHETVEQAAVREAEEETGLKVKLKEILGVYSDPKRDPRGHTVSVVFVAKPIGGKLKAGSDAQEAKLLNVDEIDFNNLAFDHKKILRDYVKWKKSKGTFWSSK